MEIIIIIIIIIIIQKLALTSPTGGGRSVGIVRSRTKAMEFSLVCSQSHTKHITWIMCQDPVRTAQ